MPVTGASQPAGSAVLRGTRPSSALGQCTGSRTPNTAPPPGWLAASMRPPCRRAFSQAIARPRPLPSERGACGVGLVEPVEHVRRWRRRGGRGRGRGPPGPAALRRPAGLDAGPDGDRRAAVPQRVADEVGDDDVEAAAVQPHGQPGRHVGGTRRPSPGPAGTPAPRLRRRCRRPPVARCRRRSGRSRSGRPPGG